MIRYLHHIRGVVPLEDNNVSYQNITFIFVQSRFIFVCHFWF